MIKIKGSKPLIMLADLLIDGSIHGVMAIDKDRRIIACNKTAENISGLKKEDLIGNLLIEVFPQLRDDEVIIGAIENAMDGKTCFVPAEPTSINKNFFASLFIPLKGSDENVLGAVIVTQDVLHRIKNGYQIEKLSTRLDEKHKQLETVNTEFATFISTTGNDLKEPIQKLYTSLEFIIKNDSGNLSNSSKANLRRIQGSINRIHLLLDDILKLSTVSSLSQNFIEVDLSEVLAVVLKDLHEKILDKRAEVSFEKLPIVYGSSQMIYYLFYNIISNSLKFHQEEKNPQINISCDSSLKSAENEKEFIVIIFSDAGIGFEQSESEKIFKLFEKLNVAKKIPGSGIGLTLCRKIMETHGGYIEAVSIPGTGATFKCYFPKHN